MERYLELSAWLADINNEREEKNQTYSYHLSSLEKFVMIKFDQELTVVPAVSSVCPPSILTAVVWRVQRDDWRGNTVEETGYLQGGLDWTQDVG